MDDPVENVFNDAYSAAATRIQWALTESQEFILPSKINITVVSPETALLRAIEDQSPVSLPPTDKRRRRGDSGGTGLRTIRDGSVTWRGHKYFISPAQEEQPYDGTLEGKRAVFAANYYAREEITLQQCFDLEDRQLLVRRVSETRLKWQNGKSIPYVVLKTQIMWRRWIRLDIFDD